MLKIPVPPNHSVRIDVIGPSPSATITFSAMFESDGNLQTVNEIRVADGLGSDVSFTVPLSGTNIISMSVSSSGMLPDASVPVLVSLVQGSTGALRFAGYVHQGFLLDTIPLTWPLNNQNRESGGGSSSPVGTISTVQASGSGTVPRTYTVPASTICRLVAFHFSGEASGAGGNRQVDFEITDGTNRLYFNRFDSLIANGNIFSYSAGQSAGSPNDDAKKGHCCMSPNNFFPADTVFSFALNNAVAGDVLDDCYLTIESRSL